MRRYLFVHRSRRGRKGAAFAVAMLVVALLSVGGIVALNAASFDISSTHAVRTGGHARSVAETGLALGRCEMCDSLDGITVAMQQVRQNEGRSATFVMRDQELQPRLPTGTTFFETATPGRRDSFGYVGTSPTVVFTVTIDRPRESGGVAGYALRESAGSDSGTLCFRQYRVTSTSTFTPPLAPTSPTHGVSRAEQRAYIVAGPVECSM